MPRANRKRVSKGRLDTSRGPRERLGVFAREMRQVQAAPSNDLDDIAEGMSVFSESISEFAERKREEKAKDDVLKGRLAAERGEERPAEASEEVLEGYDMRHGQLEALRWLGEFQADVNDRIERGEITDPEQLRKLAQNSVRQQLKGADVENDEFFIRGFLNEAQNALPEMQAQFMELNSKQVREQGEGNFFKAGALKLEQMVKAGSELNDIEAFVQGWIKDGRELHRIDKDKVNKLAIEAVSLVAERTKEPSLFDVFDKRADGQAGLTHTRTHGSTIAEARRRVERLRERAESEASDAQVQALWEEYQPLAAAGKFTAAKGFEAIERGMSDGLVRSLRKQSLDAQADSEDKLNLLDMIRQEDLVTYSTLDGSDQQAAVDEWFNTRIIDMEARLGGAASPEQMAALVADKAEFERLPSVLKTGFAGAAADPTGNPERFQQMADAYISLKRMAPGLINADSIDEDHAVTYDTYELLVKENGLSPKRVIASLPEEVEATERARGQLTGGSYEHIVSEVMDSTFDEPDLFMRHKLKETALLYARNGNIGDRKKIVQLAADHLQRNYARVHNRWVRKAEAAGEGGVIPAGWNEEVNDWFKREWLFKNLRDSGVITGSRMGPEGYSDDDYWLGRIPSTNVTGEMGVFLQGEFTEPVTTVHLGDVLTDYQKMRAKERPAELEEARKATEAERRKRLNRQVQVNWERWWLTNHSGEQLPAPKDQPGFKQKLEDLRGQEKMDLGLGSIFKKFLGSSAGKDGDDADLFNP